jgi:hypothetical protein
LKKNDLCYDDIRITGKSEVRILIVRLKEKIMKKMFSVLMGFAVLMLLTSEVGAASDKAKKEPPGSVSKQSTAKQVAPPVADDKPDDIQKQYLSRLSDINFEVESAHLTLLFNFRRNKIQHAMVMNELRYRGRIPNDVQMKGQELKDEKTRTEGKIKDLKREKENLKLDALKYYNGKMPEWLSEEWQKEESRHSNNINENYTEKLREELNQ